MLNLYSHNLERDDWLMIENMDHVLDLWTVECIRVVLARDKVFLSKFVEKIVEIFSHYKIGSLGFYRSRFEQVFCKLEKDIAKYPEKDPAIQNEIEASQALGFRVSCLYRLANMFWLSGERLIAKRIQRYIQEKFSVDIHPGASIGEGFFLDHGLGTVIGETAILGHNVTIYHGVTLGALKPLSFVSNRFEKRHPTLENNVIVYCGATILGGDTVVGEGVEVGCHEVLTSSRWKKSF